MEYSQHSNRLGVIGAMSLAPDSVSDLPPTLAIPLRTLSSGSSLVENAMLVPRHPTRIAARSHYSRELQTLLLPDTMLIVA